ncbi:MAG: putative portal protein [Prokaryotic dsDNA virus sp.]|jgi:hypothetical protein|nr:MAG: putative portal protein [Prokaryotic dsDNA virus sp.]|tara:strand:+ start:5895 stop:7382 length:1488 start_codon:yes stop_codon:yes gene_type:complete
MAQSSYSVSTVSTTVQNMLNESQRVVDVDMGGPHMRKQATKYLPQFPQETAEDYNARLQSSSLFNGVNKFVEDAAGKVFQQPVALKSVEDNPLSEFTSNIDLEGRDLSNFANDVFNAGMLRGVSFVMVDAPRRDGEVTRGQAQAMNLRPSMSFLPLDDVLGWKWENINNAPMLTQFRNYEEVEDPDRDEFSDETLLQIRVQDLVEGRVRVRLYRGTTTSSKGGLVNRTTGRVDGTGFELAEEYTTDQTQIMVAPFYTERAGFMVATSPLQDLTEINLAHWRLQSDKASCLHKSLSPLLFLKNMGVEAEETGELVISTGYAFAANSDTAGMEWVEISGSGIDKARIELKDLEFQMQAMGLQLVISKTGGNTATGDAIDEQKQNSRLSIYADNLKDTLETCMGWMAELAGTPDADTDVFVNKEYAALNHLSMDQVRDMYIQSVISKRTYIAEARRRGVLDEDVDADDEADLIVEEGGDMFNEPAAPTQPVVSDDNSV